MLIPRLVVPPAAAAGEVAALRERARQLSYCGPVVLVPAEAPAAADAERWADVLLELPCRFGPVPATEVDVIAEWLNSGALAVVVNGPIDKIFELQGQLPRDRLIAVVDDLLQLTRGQVERLATCVGGVVVNLKQDAGIHEIVEHGLTCWEELGGFFPNGFSFLLDSSVGTAADRADLVGQLHHLNGSDHPIHVECDSVRIQHDKEDGEDDFDGIALADALVACLKTDRPDNLFATVVTDEHGVALGLVYSSESSLHASLCCGRGVYWSRSRNALWRKGDTSGAFQELVSIAFDCDADAVRFCVRQRGEPPSFCHQGWRTCWGPDTGLAHLCRTLEDRKRNAPEGSYTKRLFDDRALLRNKLLEEAQEVIEAVEENDPKHVAEEVADLAYFLFTACAAGGATLEDVTNVLDMRSRKVKRRPGNAKEHRIKAAEAALDSINNANDQGKAAAESEPAPSSPPAAAADASAAP